MTAHAGVRADIPRDAEAGREFLPWPVRPVAGARCSALSRAVCASQSGRRSSDHRARGLSKHSSSGEAGFNPGAAQRVASRLTARQIGPVAL
jgi:hypothetical protein